MSTSRTALTPWERQPDETYKAYRAFCTCRDLPTEERSVLVAWRRRKGGKQADAKRAPGYFERWATEYRWRERATAYDAYIDSLVRAEREQLWIARRAELKDRTWDLAQKLREKFEQMLAFPLTRRIVSQDDGSTIIIEPIRWRFSDARQIIETVDSLERLATCEPNERIEATGPESRPRIEDLDLSNLTRDELEQFLALVGRARGDNGSDGSTSPRGYTPKP